jgi:hypothetical protein
VPRKTSIPACIFSIVTFFMIIFITTLLIAVTAVAQTQSTTVFRGPTVYDSGGSLGWTAAVADLRGNGKADILVVNYSGVSGEGDGSVGVLLGNGNGTFQPTVVYDSGGGGTNNIVIADLNRDGRPDIVLANQGCHTLNVDCVGVLLGNGDGTFRPVAVYADGYIGWAGGGNFHVPMMIADINGDGKLDLFVVSQTDKNLGDGLLDVLLGNGDGTFQPVKTYDSGGFGAFSASMSDVNGDAKLDVVVFNCVTAGPTDCLGFNKEGVVGVLLGNGDGTFQAVRKYGSGGVAWFNPPLVIADVNHDSKPDILTGNYCPNNNCTTHGSLGVLLGNGDGSFRSAVTYDPGAGAAPLSMAVADLNGDGNVDVVVGPGIGVFLGNGDGTLQPVAVYPWIPASQVFVADLNHDGKLDLLGINSSASDPDNTADVLLGNGDGTFRGPEHHKLGGTQFANATLADLNGDKKPDLVAANWCCRPTGYEEGTVGVLLNISKSASSATLLSSLNPSIYGQKVTWTAKVSTAGAIPPTGTVAFTWSDGFSTFTIGTATLNSSGSATMSKSNLNADPYPLTAVYRGDVNNLNSTSAVLNLTVLQTTSVATITSSLNPSIVGQAVTFTAKITSPTVLPTGPVTFTAGTTLLGSVQLSGGRASFTTSSIAAGSTVVKVSYKGNSNIKGSSAALTQVVQR